MYDVTHREKLLYSTHGVAQVRGKLHLNAKRLAPPGVSL